jgi:SAM-dependent methyltransferase
MVIDSDPSLGSPYLARLVDEISTLREGVEAFVAIEESDAGPVQLYHQVLGAVHQLCASIVACEEAGFNREQIVQVLEPVRRIHARSDFVRRLQQWPRGYPGDFETVEYLCHGRSRAEQGTIQDICETYSLTRAIAQQHRNKVQHQAARVMRTLLDKAGAARVFSIACGSCPDFRQIAAHLPSLLGELWLNDSDDDALMFSARALQHVHGRVHLRPGNAIKVVRKTAMNGVKFDLVLAGGLFDYLRDEHAAYLIKHAWSLLAPGGTFFFTNIARGNPYRPLIEYFGDWFLIERSESDVLRLCDDAGIPRQAIEITREETGLTLMIELRRP